MSKVKDKIAKLLALAGSPNDKEAQEALLKARELMAKHKLSPEECQQERTTKVVKQTVGVECTKMTDTWAMDLGVIIGNRYCCKTFRRQAKHAKKVTLGFIGLEDDFEVCRRVYTYAYDYIKSRCHDIKLAYRNWNTTTTIREACNAYGWGFCRGLDAAFQEQEKEHQEWGLALVVPQDVEDAAGQLGKPSTYGKENTSGWRTKYARVGYMEGKKFAPDHQLEPVAQ